MTGRRDLEDRLRAEGLDPGAWSNGPGDRYGAHEHGYDKVLVCASGSIRFGLPGTGRDGRARGSGTGSTCRRTPRTTRVVGPDGVTCLEAHLPAGRLRGTAVRPAGTW